MSSILHTDERVRGGAGSREQGEGEGEGEGAGSREQGAGSSRKQRARREKEMHMIGLPFQKSPLLYSSLMAARVSSHGVVLFMNQFKYVT